MDIEKDSNREAFEAWFESRYDAHFMQFALDLDMYVDKHTQRSWESWQAAKAQAVPDGFVVVPKEPTQEMIDKFPEVFYQDTYAGECSMWVGDETIRNGYKAMIEAQEQAND